MSNIAGAGSAPINAAPAAPATTATPQTTNTPATAPQTAAPAAAPASSSNGSTASIASDASPAAASTTAAGTGTPAEATKNTSLLSTVATTESPTAEPNAQPTEADPAKPAAATAPYEVVIPEGVTVKDEAAFTALKEVLQRNGLAADKAPELISFLNTKAQEFEAKAQADASSNQISVWEATNKKWVDAVKADPETGGANWPVVEKNLGLLMKEYGSDLPNLRNALDYTGAGNHPDILKFLARIGNKLSEGNQTALGSAPNVGKGKTKSKTLYNGA